MLSESEFSIVYHWKIELFESLWNEIINPIDRSSLPLIPKSLYEAPFIHPLAGYLESVSKYGYNVAMIFEDGSKMTYNEMHVKVMTLAKVLKKSGLKENDVIAVDAPRHLGLPIWIHAIWMIGGVYIALGSRDALDRKKRILEICQAKCVLVDVLNDTNIE